jgi:prolyl oligopeptidase
MVAAAVACTHPSGATDTAEPSATSSEVDSSPQSQEDETLAYPNTRRQDVVIEKFGHTVPDPYRWLEDGEDEQVRSWMRKQDDVARSYLQDLPTRSYLESRFKELFYVEEMSAPKPRGEFLFYERRAPQQEKDVFYWTRRGSDEEHVLLDPNEMGGEETNVSVDQVYPSRDGKYVAYKVRENNADASTLHVMETTSGQRREVDTIPNTKYAFPSWTPDNDGFYYTYLPKGPDISTDQRPGYAEVRYHKLGRDYDADPVIRPKTGDPTTFQYVYVSEDGEWLVHMIQYGWNSADVYLKKRGVADAQWLTLTEGTEASYQVNVWDGSLIIQTDREASNRRVMRLSTDVLAETPDEAPPFDKWKTLVPEREEAVLEQTRIIGGHLVLNYLEKATSRVRIHDFDGSHVRDLSLPELGTVSSVHGEPESRTIYYEYQSFTRPPQAWETTVDEPTRKLWGEVEVPADLDDISVNQATYTSKDGTEVTMFIVHKKGLDKDGAQPAMLWGYGGFNVSITPGFRRSILPWLEAGGVFAVPNLRGGGAYGESWHEAGMRENKQNVFDDFVAAAEYLVDEGYTSSDRLAIRGGSNGGLLVGAAMTQRPDLFSAVICSVPLLDMLRYHLVGSGRTWMEEYGNPDEESAFNYLLEYSPYHNVESDVDYPPLLLLSADSDDRVAPMHARKFAAAVQHANPDGEPALLRVEQNAGHTGADMVKKWVQEAASSWAFVAEETGVEFATSTGSDGG